MKAVDEHIRTEALDPNTSFIVEAPAGSGKTELLTRRLLKLLTLVKNPENIIALTFTKKAAAQMLERVIQSLQEAQTSNEQSIKMQLARKVLQHSLEQNWHLLENTNRLKITTIDSLCATVSGQTPLLAKLAGGSNIISDPRELYEIAIKRSLQLIEGEDDAADAMRKFCLLLNNNTNLILQLSCSMLGSRDKWLRYIVTVKSDAEFINNTESLLQDIKEFMTAKFFKHFSPYKKELHQVVTQLEGVGVIKDDYALALQLIKICCTSTFKLRKRFTKAQGLAPKSSAKEFFENLIIKLHDNTEVLELAEILTKIPASDLLADSKDNLHTIIMALMIFVAQLNLVFNERGCIDFIENSLGALNALGDASAPSDLALYLDHQIQHLLIDEFQDTSYTQFMLFEKLIAGWERGDGRSLFIVGDPMQSIYRFRQAEVGLFLQACQHGIGDVSLQHLCLQSNFRSCANLIAWVNQHFARILQHDSEMLLGITRYRNSLSARGELNNDAVQSMIFEQNDGLLEEQFIVNTIKELQDQAPGASIAILVRNRSHLLNLIALLQEQQINFYAQEIDAMYCKAHIQDLLAITRLVFDPLDLSAWYGILRAPWCAATLMELEALQAFSENMHDALANLGQITAIGDASKQRLTHVYRAINNTMKLLGRVSVATLVHDLWQRLGGEHIYRAEQQDVKDYFILLKTLEPEGLDLPKLMQALGKRYVSHGVLEQNSVQIMTIHKAKGLEFDYVFLPFLSKAAATSDKPLLLWKEFVLTAQHGLLLAPYYVKEHASNATYNFLKLLDKISDKHEDIRVLYVALTRACRRCYLTATLEYDEKIDNFKKPSSNSLLSFLWDELDYTAVRNVEEKVNQQAHTQKLLKQVELAPFEVLSPMCDNPSNAGLQCELDDYHTQLGIFVHQYLANFAFNHDLPAEILDYEFNRLRIAVNYRPLILQSLAKINANLAQDSFAQQIFSSKNREVLCEQKFFYQEKGQLKFLVPDRTFINQRGERWIVDYKITAPATQSMEEFLQEQVCSYQDKLKEYALLFQQDKIIKLYLYFPLIPATQEIVFDLALA